MEKIEELWIIENSGICLFNHSIGKVDETLFSGFLSSIQTFLETIGSERIKKIELGNSKLIIYNLDEYKIFLVLRSSGRIKEKFLKKKLEEIQKRFILKFGTYLVEQQAKSLPYNTEIFADFHQDLREIFEEDIDRNIKKFLGGI